MKRTNYIFCVIFCIFEKVNNQQRLEQEDSVYYDPGFCHGPSNCDWVVEGWSWKNSSWTDKWNKTLHEYSLLLSANDHGILQSRTFRPTYEETLCLTFTYFISKHDTKNYLAVWISCPDFKDEEIWTVSNKTIFYVHARVPVQIIGNTSNSKAEIMIDEVVYNWIACNTVPERALITPVPSTMTTLHLLSLTSQHALIATLNNGAMSMYIIGIIVSMSSVVILASYYRYSRKRGHDIFCKRLPPNVREESNRDTTLPQEVCHAHVPQIQTAGEEDVSNSIGEDTVQIDCITLELRKTTREECKSRELSIQHDPSEIYDHLEELRTTIVSSSQHHTSSDDYDHLTEQRKVPEHSVRHNASSDGYDHLTEQRKVPELSVRHNASSDDYDHLTEQRKVPEHSVRHGASSDDYDHLEKMDTA